MNHVTAKFVPMKQDVLFLPLENKSFVGVVIVFEEIIHIFNSE